MPIRLTEIINSIVQRIFSQIFIRLNSVTVELKIRKTKKNNNTRSLEKRLPILPEGSKSHDILTI